MDDVSPADAVVKADNKVATTVMPDYMTDPNAVLKDLESAWRFGRPPDYSKTRSFYASSKSTNSFRYPTYGWVCFPARKGG
jgi:hypothetical protein